MVTLDARLAALPSPDLLVALERSAAQGRELTADLIALLTECDTRRLYATEGYPSLFEFCVTRLHLSESQAYHRIQAARAAKRFPLVLERLREGRVSLTAVALLREHLTEANHREVLDWADGRRKREVEEFVRRLDPRPDASPSLRRLAPPRPAALVSPSAPRQPRPLAGRPAPAEVHPTAPGRYSLRITISEETADKLRRAQALLGHGQPPADPAVILDRALTLLLAQLERCKAGAPPKPGRSATAPARPTAAARRDGDGRECQAADTALLMPSPIARGPAGSIPATRTAQGHEQTVEKSNGAAMPGAEPVSHRVRGRTTSGGRRSRYIPAPVRRAVWDRDGGCCAFVSANGTRCTATAALEFHHRIPFAEGGASSVDNVSLACAVHNAVEAARWFNFDRTEFGVGESGSRGPVGGAASRSAPSTAPAASTALS